MMYLLTWGSKRALSAKLLYCSAGTCLATQEKGINQLQRTPPHLPPASKHVISRSHDDHMEGGFGSLWVGPEGRMRSSES